MARYTNHISLTNWELVSVNPKEKNWTSKTLFNLWANSIQTVIGFSLIASLYVSYGLNGNVVFIGTMFAGILAILLANLSGTPCQKMGIPFPVFLRVSFGIYGAKYGALLRGMAAISMFGIQTFFISKSLSFLIRIFIFSIDKNLLQNEFINKFFLSLGIIDWAGLVLASLIQYFLFTRGIKLIKKIINFSGILIYFAIFILASFVFLKNQTDLINSFVVIFDFKKLVNLNNLFPIITITGTMFAYFSIMLLNFGDYSRYVQNKNELKKGNLSLLINIILFSFLAVIITIGSDILLHQNLISLEKILTNPTDIIGQFDQITLSIFGLILILISTISTNLIVNFIPSNNVFINFFPNIASVKISGMLISLVGFIIGSFWISFISRVGLLSIIDTIAAFLGPLFGIIVVDYYFVKKQKIVSKDLFSSDPSGKYYYSNGWCLKSFYSLFVAFIYSAATIWNTELRFLNSFSFLIGAFVSGYLQYLLSEK